MKKRKRAILPPPIKAPTANPYDSGSELENPCGFEYDAYNCSSLAEELGVVELNKGFATHRPRMSFNSAASMDQGFGGYDDDAYALDSLHRNKSVRVSAGDPNVNVHGNFKSPVSVPVCPAIASASTSTLASVFRFSGEHMIRVQMGLLVGRPSLEEGCLMADGDGEDVGMNVSMGGLRMCFFFSLFFFRMLNFMYVNRSTHSHLFLPFCTNLAYGWSFQVKHMYFCLWG